MEYKCDVYSDYVIITIEGMLVSIEEADILYALIKKQTKNGIKKIIIDLRKVNYVSSMVVGFLIKINDELNNISGKFVLCDVQQSVLEVFKVTKVNLILQIFENREKAVEHLSNMQ